MSNKTVAKEILKDFENVLKAEFNLHENLEIFLKESLSKILEKRLPHPPSQNTGGWDGEL